MAYTDAQVAALKAVEGLNYEKAKAFAEKHGLTVRSVIAKARALELPYTSKLPGAKKTATKPQARRKAEIVTTINELLDLNLASLEKLTAADLTVLEKRVEELTAA